MSTRVQINNPCGALVYNRLGVHQKFTACGVVKKPYGQELDVEEVSGHPCYLRVIDGHRNNTYIKAADVRKVQAALIG